MPVKYVTSANEFFKNLNNRFMSSEWLDTIDFSKFVIVGGCVVNALFHSSFPDFKEQDVNLISVTIDPLEFEAAVTNVINMLQKRVLKDSKNQLKVEKVPGSLNCDIFLPCGIKLNFLFKSVPNSQIPLSHVLHNFDMDICQVAFTGRIFVLY